MSPHPLVDADWYDRNNPGALNERRCALTHFLEEGALRGRSPHPLFDAEWYLETYPDVAHAGINPLVHYLQSGAQELRDPQPHFQTRWYYAAYPEARETNALLHYLEVGGARARPNVVFDPLWYRRKYGHLIPDGRAPFEHFLEKGRHIGLQPGPWFDPKTWRRNDVAPTREADATALFLDAFQRNWDTDNSLMRRRLTSPLVLSPPSPTKILSPPAQIRSIFTRRKRSLETRRKRRIAVHLHLFYPELSGKMASALGLIPFPFDLYVTIADREHENEARDVFSRLDRLNRLDIRWTENRGRDIAPFIVACGAELADYDFILHLHTKKSPHNRRLTAWLDYLLELLLGSPENIRSILEAFDSRADLGMLFPVPYAPVRPFMRLGGNAAAIQSLLARFGARADPARGLFTDQRWIDLAPAFFEEVHVVRDRGCNVATWNIHHRPLKRNATGALEAGGDLLRFYHFTGYDSGDGQGVLLKYASDQMEAHELWAHYGRELRAAGHGDPTLDHFAYGCFASGDPIDRDLRRLYRSRKDLQESFPDPFEVKKWSLHSWWREEKRGRQLATL